MPDDKWRKAALIVLFGWVAVWAPFWLFAQFHWGKYIGPFHVFSLQMAPMPVGPALLTIGKAPPERRGRLIAVLVATVVILIGFVPVLAMMGVVHR